jgi:hypothetical protein
VTTSSSARLKLQIQGRETHHQSAKSTSIKLNIQLAEAGRDGVNRGGPESLESVYIDECRSG